MPKPNPVQATTAPLLLPPPGQPSFKELASICKSILPTQLNSTQYQLGTNSKPTCNLQLLLYSAISCSSPPPATCSPCLPTPMPSTCKKTVGTTWSFVDGVDQIIVLVPAGSEWEGGGTPPVGGACWISKHKTTEFTLIAPANILFNTTTDESDESLLLPPRRRARQVSLSLSG